MLHGKTKSVCDIIPSDSSSSCSNSRYSRLSFLLFWCAIAGCTSLKKAALIGGGSLGAGAIASIATSGTAPVLLAAAGGASVTSVVVDVMTPKTGDTTLNNCAESNFWDVVGQLIEMGGWLLILVVLIPMVLGWILPGPLERKKK
tara:strand:- start:431 stop:865 length:435 start_codon:yes stop_codon:yes gene_type:complete